MDWTAIIEKNRDALLRILATLTNMASLRAAGSPDSTITPARPSDDGRAPHTAAVERPTLPRHLHRFILSLLRPAEAATRRLIIMAARDVPAMPQARREESVTLLAPRKPRPKATSIFVRDGKGTGIVPPRGVRPEAILPGLATPRPPRRTLALPLLDPLPPWQRKPPSAGRMLRISAPGFAEPARLPVPRPRLPGDQIDATRLALRLAAVGRALDDLPSQARRFARWRYRVAAGAQNKESSIATAANPPLRSGGGGLKDRRGHVATRFARLWPLRPGRPPGGRRRSSHEIHEVLKDVHHFAVHALERRDTS